MMVVRTSTLSTNAASLRAYLVENKQSKSKMGKKTVLSHGRRKSYPRELLG
jgi:hypothetical protein